MFVQKKVAFGGKEWYTEFVLCSEEGVILSKFAVFVDLENCGAKVATLNSILDKVKIRGDILLGKVYGYTDRFSDLKEVLLNNN